MRTVNFYHRLNGQIPVEEFLDSLTGKQAQKVLWVLELIEELETVPRRYFKWVCQENAKNASAGDCACNTPKE